MSHLAASLRRVAPLATLLLVLAGAPCLGELVATARVPVGASSGDARKAPTSTDARKAAARDVLSAATRPATGRRRSGTPGPKRSDTARPSKAQVREVRPPPALAPSEKAAEPREAPAPLRVSASTAYRANAAPIEQKEGQACTAPTDGQRKPHTAVLPAAPLRTEDAATAGLEALPNPPANIDLDSELENGGVAADVAQFPSPSTPMAQKAAAAAEGARQAAQRGMVALSLYYQRGLAQALEYKAQAKEVCCFERVERCVRQLPALASRLVPPTPARRGLQTLVTESASLWAAALWKILMLQVLVVMKTIVSQGSVIARSFVQAASLEPTALVPDSPLLQRQRSRAKAIAASKSAEEARIRMNELQAKMAQAAEQLAAAERVAAMNQADNECKWTQSIQWSNSGFRQPGSHGGQVSFQGSSGSLLPAASRGRRMRAEVYPQTPPRGASQPLLMSASRRTPLPDSPLPPATPSFI